MKPFYKNLKFITVGVFTFLGVSISDISAQTSIPSIGTAITQNFDSLNATFYPSLTWTNQSTLSNWYALDQLGNTPTTFVLNDGEASTAELTSFGSALGVDRALGFAPLGAIDNQMYVAWHLKNSTSKTISSLIVKWRGEQWRVENNDPQQIDLLFYKTSSPFVNIDVAQLQDQGQSISSKKFLIGASKLDGNLSANNTYQTDTIYQSLSPNEEIVIVWRFTDNEINQLMAIDDVEISARENQTISGFSLPTGKIYGDADFTTGAVASSGLPISYNSTNSNVAVGVGTSISIKGPGTAYITPLQIGNSIYSPVSSTALLLTIKPKVPVTNAATSISSSGFTANWTADNGLNDAGVSYVLEYSLNSNFAVKTTMPVVSTKFNLIPGLSANQIYYYRLRSRTSLSNYSSYTVASAITTGSDYVTVNTGNWDTGTNWDVGNISNIANSITVRHPILLDAARTSVTTNKLIIESTGKLTTNQIINVTNELVIYVADNGTAGQILNTNNIIIGENAKIIVRKTFATGWNFIGFPFTVTDGNIFIANTTTPLTWGNLNSGANFIVQQYNGATRASTSTANYTGAGLHWVNVSPKQFTAKKGYLVYNNTVHTIDFTSRGSNIGTFFSRTGASVPTGLYPSSNEHANWNLIASPLSTKYNLASTSPSTSYYTYNGVNYLPALAGESLDVQPFSAFFLQAPSTSLSFGNGGRKVIAASRKEETPVDEIYLNLSNGNSTYDDITRIRLQEGASADYEIGTDAAKMLGVNPNVSYIYTTINNAGIAINTLPNTVTEVELNTKFVAVGNYSISISNIEKVQNYSAVVLVDKTTGKRTDLLSVGSYEYNVSAAGTVNRFKVQLSPKITTGVSLSEDQSLSITSQQGNATISGLSTSTQVRVYDTTGKKVFNGLVNNNEPIRFENKGLYIFEIATSEKTEKIKAFVR